MASEASRDEVLHWLARTGMGAADAAKHFFPGDDVDQRKRRETKYRKWVHRYGLPTTTGAPASGGRGAPGASVAPGPSSAAVVSVPPPNTTVAALGTVERLEWLLAYASAGVEHAHARGDVQALSAASKAVLSIGKELDQARENQGKVQGLERTAEGLAKAITATAMVRERLARHMAHSAAVRAKERTL